MAPVREHLASATAFCGAARATFSTAVLRCRKHLVSHAHRARATSRAFSATNNTSHTRANRDLGLSVSAAPVHLHTSRAVRRAAGTRALSPLAPPPARCPRPPLTHTHVVPFHPRPRRRHTYTHTRAHTAMRARHTSAGQLLLSLSDTHAQRAHTPPTRRRISHLISPLAPSARPRSLTGAQQARTHYHHHRHTHTHTHTALLIIIIVVPASRAALLRKHHLPSLSLPLLAQPSALSAPR